jgi:hypothetical protein
VKGRTPRGINKIRRVKFGSNYDMTLLAALVARLGLGLHGAITGDMTFKTT